MFVRPNLERNELQQHRDQNFYGIGGGEFMNARVFRFLFKIYGRHRCTFPPTFNESFRDIRTPFDQANPSLRSQ